MSSLVAPPASIPAWPNGPIHPITDEEIENIHGWWRAANYLSVGQIYLMDNPLLRTPLNRDHVKPRLLGHWGTTPGLTFMYAHANRAIRQRDLNAVFVTGPGHGGPGLVAASYLEHTYAETYPDITEDEGGLKRLFTQFSFPGGIPSHVAPETPGSIHEGGELGYALSHAYGAMFDNPDQIAFTVVGDGEPHSCAATDTTRSSSPAASTGSPSRTPIATTPRSSTRRSTRSPRSSRRRARRPRRERRSSVPPGR
jgi:xylulose-5-phosphate/fructose-6-phosphate phosphoketolase